MRYTFKDLVDLVHVTKRAEFTKIYEYIHKTENQPEDVILNKVSQHFDVPTRDIMSHKRFAEVVLARQVYMVTIKVCSTKTLAQVARIVEKDHATVCHAMKTLRMDYEFNPVRRNKIRHYISSLDQVKQELLLDFFNERNPDILTSYSANTERVTAPSESEA
jgi:chromosomal replication initiation ATPase DnaA